MSSFFCRTWVSNIVFVVFVSVFLQNLSFSFVDKKSGTSVFRFPNGRPDDDCSGLTQAGGTPPGMRHPSRGAPPLQGRAPPAGVRHPFRVAPPLKGWRQGCATPPGARHPPGWRHPCRVAPPLQGWRPPVSSRHNHHLVARLLFVCQPLGAFPS